MIALDTPTMVLQASSPTGELVAHVVARTVPQATKGTYEEYQSRVTRTVFTSATNVTICAAPEVNSFKAIEYIGIMSTGAVTVSVSTYDGTTRCALIVQALLANQGLYYEEHRGWYLVSP